MNDTCGFCVRTVGGGTAIPYPRQLSRADDRELSPESELDDRESWPESELDDRESWSVTYTHRETLGLLRQLENMKLAGAFGCGKVGPACSSRCNASQAEIIFIYIPSTLICLE